MAEAKALVEFRCHLVLGFDHDGKQGHLPARGQSALQSVGKQARADTLPAHPKIACQTADQCRRNPFVARQAGCRLVRKVFAGNGIGGQAVGPRDTDGIVNGDKHAGDIPALVLSGALAKPLVPFRVAAQWGLSSGRPEDTDSKLAARPRHPFL